MSKHNHETLTKLRINKILQDQKDLEDELQLIHIVLFQDYVSDFKVNQVRQLYMSEYKYLTKEQIVDYLTFTINLYFNDRKVKPEFTLSLSNDIINITRIS
jgi:hypothetical protein